MPIITKPALAKGDSVFFTLDKTALAAVGSVAADPFLASPNNWEKVVIEFDSSESNQSKIVVFDPSQVTPEGLFFTTVNARGDFLVRKINIYGPQGYKLVIPRSSLTTAEFDVIFAASIAGWSSTYYNNSAATLSNGNLTATIDLNTGQGIVLYVDNQITYGGGEKVYKEITLNHRQNNTFFTVGMRVFNTVPSDFTPSNTANFNTLTDEVAELYWEGSSSSIKYSIDNGSAVNAFGGYPSFSTNDVIMVALDTSVDKIWFGKNGAWIGGADPATNSGGIDYAAPFAGVSNMNNIFIAVMDYDFGTPDPQFTINDSPLYTPAGFTEI